MKRETTTTCPSGHKERNDDNNNKYMTLHVLRGITCGIEDEQPYGQSQLLSPLWSLLRYQVMGEKTQRTPLPNARRPLSSKIMIINDDNDNNINR